MSTVYSANIRVEVKSVDVEVTIFGDLEGVRLLDTYLRSRIGGLSKADTNTINNSVEIITYEDATGKTFDEAFKERR